MQLSPNPLTQESEPPLSQFDRSTQRKPSTHEYIAEGPSGGRGGRSGRSRIRGAGLGCPGALVRVEELLMPLANPRLC
jgi:hypothetical protein